MMVITDPESLTATSGEESGVNARNGASVLVPKAVGSVGGRNRFASPNLGHPRPANNINSSNTPAVSKHRQQSFLPADMNHLLK